MFEQWSDFDTARYKKAYWFCLNLAEWKAFCVNFHGSSKLLRHFSWDVFYIDLKLSTFSDPINVKIVFLNICKNPKFQISRKFPLSSAPRSLILILLKILDIVFWWVSLCICLCIVFCFLRTLETFHQDFLKFLKNVNVVMISNSNKSFPAWENVKIFHDPMGWFLKVSNLLLRYVPRLFLVLESSRKVA